MFSFVIWRSAASRACDCRLASSSSRRRRAPAERPAAAATRVCLLMHGKVRSRNANEDHHCAARCDSLVIWHLAASRVCDCRNCLPTAAAAGGALPLE